MHAKDAGLVEHLSAAIGAPIDRVAVRGSGATATRIELLRRRDQMAGKKAVIWLFAARDLTESDGWRVVPVIKPKSSIIP
jgi:alginate O-acetyltransferase complex protein AlgJ